MNDNQNPSGQPDDERNSTAEVLRQAGASEEEIRRTGAMDRSDDQVDTMFKHTTAASPVHIAVWDGDASLDLFRARLLDQGESCWSAMRECLAIARRHYRDGTLYNPTEIAAEKLADRVQELLDQHQSVANLGDSDTPNNFRTISQLSTIVDQYHQNEANNWHCGKLRDEVLQELAQAGYWGMLIDPKYGGQGASTRSFMHFLTQMASQADPTIAGLGSIHGCIGAVDPVRTFGTENQKQRLLPKLASGERLSGFALTEPCAGSDLTALRTTAELPEELRNLPTAQLNAAGTHFLVNGEKLFISNAIYGRTIGLVCLINEKPAVLIVDLPDSDTDNFQIIRYGLYALRRTYNNGLRFKDFTVPADNLLTPPKGDGLTIAYHGLNLGRLALCATAAGNLRRQLQSLISWVNYRKTYGKPIGQRQLVLAKIGRLVSYIVLQDALVDWGSSLLDEGYRGELECIIAKIFGGELQKDATINLTMKTHGGRSFLHGHLVGDNIHDLLAPCIYEGVADMLSMGLFKGLVKKHSDAFMIPIGECMGNLKKGKDVWQSLCKFGKLAFSYAGWQAKKRWACWFGHNQAISGMNKRLASHVTYAQNRLRRIPLLISGSMVKYQVAMVNEQCLVDELSQQAQFPVVMLVTALHAHDSSDELTTLAADMACRELSLQIHGKRPSQKHWKALAKLGKKVLEGHFHQLDDVPDAPIQRPYEDK